MRSALRGKIRRVNAPGVVHVGAPSQAVAPTESARIEQLIGVVQELSRVRSLEDVLAIVRSAARGLSGADGATFVLRDGDECHYADEDAIAPLWKGQRFPLSACISGWVMLNGQAVAIEDIYQDDRIPADAYRPTFVKSLVMTPIRSTEAIGAIGCYWATHRVASSEDLKLLQALADSTAIAMENVRMLGRLVKAERQLHHAQKMEAVGRLAGGVAHDFNNVLTVVTSYAEMMRAALHPGEPMHAELSEITAAAERGTNLTKQLLAFSRRQVLETKVVDLNQVLSGMGQMLPRLLGADVRLTVLPESGLGRVLADPGQLEQIVMNLVVNARDAMPTGGQLTIRTANVELDDAYSDDHHDVLPGPYVLLAVSDTGEGMDAQTQSRIFEPFFTTKESGKGTGLGLATVFGIVNQSNGYIWVYSEPGRGTTFKIYLPRTGDAPPLPTEVRATPLETRGTETILLAEDDAQVRGVARSILRRSGYVVLEAANAGEALLLCEQHGANIDLLITDVILPIVSGRELAARLRQQRPDLLVLFMSGYTDDAVRQHGILDSGVAFLQKPFTPASLTTRVRAVLDAARDARRGG